MKVLNIKNKKSTCILLFTLTALAILAKAFFGYGWNDEAYFLNLAMRFGKGDILLYHDWYPSQWSGIILAPLYCLYHAIKGSNEGIVLFFRLFWTAMVIAEGGFVWWTIKKYYGSCVCGFISAIAVLVYSTENKALYCYSDMSVHFMILSAMLIIYALHGRCWWQWYLAGLSFVLVVICNPYNLLVYLWLLVVALVMRDSNGRRYIREVIIFTAGCLTIGMPILIYVLVNAPLTDLMASLNYMLNMPDHPAGNMFIKTVKWAWYLMKSYTIVGIVAQAVLFVYAIYQKAKKKLTDRRAHMLIWIELVLSLAYVLIQLFCMDDSFVIGIAFVPMVITGLMMFILIDQRPWELVCLLVIPGFIISLAFQWGSDTGIYAMMTGMAIAVVAVAVIGLRYLQQYANTDKNRQILPAICVLVALALCYTLGQRLLYCHYNVYEGSYNARFQFGAYKGIWSDEQQIDYYEQMRAELQPIIDNTDEDAPVLVLGEDCQAYLELDRVPASFFVFRVKADHEYWDDYYAMHPDRVPEYVYTNDHDDEVLGDVIDIGGYEYDVMPESNGRIYRLSNDEK